MDAAVCQKSLLQQGYLPVKTLLKNVGVYACPGWWETTDRSMVVVIGEEQSYTMDAWKAANLKNELKRDYGSFSLLFLIFTYDADGVRSRMAGDESHWIFDRMHDRLLIYEDQPDSFGNLEGIIERLKEIYPERAYHRETSQGTRRTLSREQLLSVTNLFVLINAVIYLAGVILNYVLKIGYRGEPVLEYFGALYVNDPEFDGQFYRVFTSMFLHANFRHLAGNMISLVFLGESLEQAVGRIRFAVIYLAGGLGGGITAYLYYLNFVDGPVCMVGASGAIFAVIGAIVYVLIRNRRNVNRTALPRFILYIALSIYMGATTTGVSLSAHIGGLVFGFVLAVILYHPGKTTNTHEYDYFR